MPRKCCVVNCKKYNTLRSFPHYLNDSVRFSKWVESSGNLRLLSKTPKRVFETQKVCSDHFDITIPNRSTLPKSINPNINLPDPINVPYEWLYPNTDESAITLKPKILHVIKRIKIPDQINVETKND